MTNRELLDAIGEVDAGAVMDAREGGKERNKTPRVRRILAPLVAAVLVIAMTLSAVAYYGAGDRLKSVFNQWGGNLSEGQNAFIEGAAVDVGESVSKGGYTITVASVISDGRTAMIEVNLAVPEGQLALGASFWDYALSYNGEELNTGWSEGCVDDGDGQDHTMTIILTTGVDDSGLSFADDGKWTLRLTDLCYESEEGHLEDPVVEGDWYFDLTFSQGADMAELITDPVAFEGRSSSGVPVPALLTSLTLSAMTVEYTYEVDAEGIQLLAFEDILVVMKDGSVVQNGCGWSDPGNARYELEQPIDLSEVDHILFADDVKIPMVSE